MNDKLLVLFFWLSISIQFSFAQNQTTLNFLRQEIDPVTVGLGGSAAAGGAGLFSIKQNPAHLNQVQEWEILYADRRLMHRPLREDRYHFHLAAAYRINARHSLALSWRDFYRGDIVYIDDNGYPVKIGEQEDFALTLVYGLKWSESLYAGISFKYLRSDSDFKGLAKGWAVDAGISWQIFRKSL
ncbi:MAG: hypothetical protein WAN36_07525, partial [Calditrichia bacterium]